jgi:hypothetical protein
VDIELPPNHDAPVYDRAPQNPEPALTVARL